MLGDPLTKEELERLERLKPIRIVLRPTEVGDYEGLIESSFSMSWSPSRVRIFWSGAAYDNIFGMKFTLDGVKDAEYNSTDKYSFVSDPFDSDCPIYINWKKWLDSTAKFDRRNAPFITENPVKRAVREVMEKENAKT